MRVYRPMRVKAGHEAQLHAPSHRPMSSPGYSSARLRPRRAGLRFTRCLDLTNGRIQHRSCSGSDTTFLLLPGDLRRVASATEAVERRPDRGAEVSIGHIRSRRRQG
jgi:hypothetical protein